MDRLEERKEGKSEMTSISLECSCFDKNWILQTNDNDVINNFICLICRQVSNNPFSLDCPEHEHLDEVLIVGENCLKEFQKSDPNSCPVEPHDNCQHFKNKPLQRQIDSLIAMCPRQYEREREKEGESQTTESEKIKCDFKGKIKGLGNHLNDECELKQMNCWFKLFGCNHQSLKHELNEHLTTNMKVHFDLVIKYIEILKNDFNMSQENIKQLKLEKQGLINEIDKLKSELNNNQQLVQSKENEILDKDNEINKIKREFELNKEYVERLQWENKKLYEGQLIENDLNLIKNKDRKSFKPEVESAIKKIEEEMEKNKIDVKKLHAAIEEIDKKYKFTFEAKCYFKNCDKVPEYEKTHSKDDVYICHHHRIEMAEKVEKTAKEKGYYCNETKDFLEKFKKFSDKDFIEESEKADLPNDYFPRLYACLSYERIKVTKKLAEKTLKIDSSEYWQLRMGHALLKTQAENLLILRKLFNPQWLWVVGKCVGAVVVGGLLGAGLAYCGAAYCGVNITYLGMAIGGIAQAAYCGHKYLDDVSKNLVQTVNLMELDAEIVDLEETLGRNQAYDDTFKDLRDHKTACEEAQRLLNVCAQNTTYSIFTLVYKNEKFCHSIKNQVDINEDQPFGNYKMLKIETECPNYSSLGKVAFSMECNEAYNICERDRNRNFTCQEIVNNIKAYFDGYPVNILVFEESDFCQLYYHSHFHMSRRIGNKQVHFWC